MATENERLVNVQLSTGELEELTRRHAYLAGDSLCQFQHGLFPAHLDAAQHHLNRCRELVSAIDALNRAGG